MIMNNILEYKGYHTRIEYDADAHILRGKIEGINDFIDFQCDSPADVEKEFHSAVDDYLIFCEEVGKTPEKEYKGTFNIRISPELHRKLVVRAMYAGVSLNNYISNTLEKATADL